MSWTACSLGSISARTDKNLVVPVVVVVEGFPATALKAYVTEEDKVAVPWQENKPCP